VLSATGSNRHLVLLVRVLAVPIVSLAQSHPIGIVCHLLGNHLLDGVETSRQNVHTRAVTQADEVMTRAVKQIPTPGGVQIEENTWHDNDLLLETRIEEVESIVDALRQAGEIEPQVERRVGHVRELEADFLETSDDEVTLGAEVHLQRAHLVADLGWREHLHGGFLERHVAAAVDVGAARSNGFDEFLGAEDPCYAPSWEAESLRETIEDEYVVLVDVFDVVGRRDDGTVAVGCVVVSAVEFVHNQRRAVTADVLNLRKGRVSY
jgi:hypothetical protein